MFEKAFQLILYIAGFLNTDINEAFTNKIDWRRAKKHWNLEIIDRLEAYNPFGPKSKPDSEYFMVNRLLDQINNFQKEGLAEYSVVISRLFEVITLCKFLILI